MRNSDIYWVSRKLSGNDERIQNSQLGRYDELRIIYYVETNDREGKKKKKDWGERKKSRLPKAVGQSSCMKTENVTSVPLDLALSPPVASSVQGPPGAFAIPAPLFMPPPTPNLGRAGVPLLWDCTYHINGHSSDMWLSPH